MELVDGDSERVEEEEGFDRTLCALPPTKS